MSYFRPAAPEQKVRAVPGTGLNLPIWILGSSLYGAQLAAMLGLPYAVASHFAPDQMAQAVALYRSRFRPSEQAAAPHVMLGLNVFAAASDAEAARLFTSHQQAFVNLRRGRPGPLPPPVDDIEAMLSPMEQAMVAHSLSCTIVGSPETVRHGIADFIARTGADELMITGQIFDHASRLRSFAIAAEARRELARAGTDTAK
jgi:luciferase family oxidoreductase group 1